MLFHAQSLDVAAVADSSDVAVADSDRLQRLSATDDVQKFSAFTAGQRGYDGGLVLQMDDLMRVPRLVPNVVVVDFRRGGAHLHVRFCGTRIDSEFKRNLAGRRLEDVLSGEGAGGFLNGVRRVRDDGVCFYARRNVLIGGGAWSEPRLVELFMVPCTDVSGNVTQGLGLMRFEFSDPDVDEVVSTW